MGNESAFEATNQMSTPQIKNESANEMTKMITWYTLSAATRSALKSALMLELKSELKSALKFALKSS